MGQRSYPSLPDLTAYISFPYPPKCTTSATPKCCTCSLNQRGHPPRTDYAWRESATQEIHKRLIKEYASDNPYLTINNRQYLKRATSTLHYNETVGCIYEIYERFGTKERIICTATGSKMQTVGLFLSKVMCPDIHIEYPTPDSYYHPGLSSGVREIHEITLPSFSTFLDKLRKSVTDQA